MIVVVNGLHDILLIQGKGLQVKLQTFVTMYVLTGVNKTETPKAM